MYNLYYSAYFKIMFGNEISEPAFYAKNVSIVCLYLWDIYIDYIMASESNWSMGSKFHPYLITGHYDSL